MPDCLFLFSQEPGLDLLTIPFLPIPTEILQKAGSFRKMADRNNYLAVRWIIWRLSQPGPAFGSFSFHSQGKPYLPGFLPFSISHSSQLSGVLITHSECGLDLEKMIPITNPEDFKNVLSRGELEEIKSSGGSKDLFYYYWTLREALAKFSGQGISELESLPVLKSAGDGEIIYQGSPVWPETFRFADYLIQCVRSGYEQKPPPLKICLCFPGKEGLLRMEEILYQPQKISLLTGEGFC